MGHSNERPDAPQDTTFTDEELAAASGGAETGPVLPGQGPAEELADTGHETDPPFPVI